MDQFPKIPYDHNMISTTHETLPDPFKHPEYRKVINVKGPKTLLLEEKLNHDVEEEFKAMNDKNFAESMIVDYTSTTSASYPSYTSYNDSMPIKFNDGTGFNYSNDTVISLYTVSSDGVPLNKSFKKNSAFSSGKYDM
jgi:hypothetical protein